MPKKPEAATKKPRSRLEKFISKFKFIGEILAELKKVTWPTREEAVNLTIMVIIICVIVGLMLGGLDFGFYKLINNVILGRP